MSAAQALTRALNGDWHGSYGAIPTPGHSPRDRGTTIRDRDDGKGVVVNSFNGDADTWRHVQDEGRRLGIVAEFERQDTAWRVAGTYEFADEQGTVLYRTRRVERTGQRKEFRAERPDGKGGWINGIADVRRVLYRLPELIAADPAVPVYLTEGERKADKLASWGFVATAIAFGARGGIGKHGYPEALAGRRVVILPDNDSEGHAFADAARAAIRKAGGEATILELPGLPEKGDVIDWRGTPDELRALTDAALNPPPAMLPLIDPSAWARLETPAREWLLEEWIPARQATYLTGPGSAGKSLVSQLLATCVAMGLPFMGVETRGGVAVYLTCEDDPDELHRRQKAICEGLGVPLAALAGKLHLASLVGAIGNELATFTPEGRMLTSERWATLRDTVLSLKPALLVLDNVAHLFAGNENIRNQVAAFVGLLNALAQEAGCAILFLGHPNKAGDAFSGSTAWENQVRSRLFLETPRGDDDSALDPDARVLSRGKANYARNGERMEFRWHRGTFVRDCDLPADLAGEIAANVQANGENERFLRCLAATVDQRRAVSHVKGSNYAPTIFARMTEAAGMSPAAFERALERLLHLGAIRLDQPLWRGENRHWKQGIRLASECANPPAPTPCADPRQPLGQVIDNAAPTLRAPTPLYPTGKQGAAHGAAAPFREERRPDLSRVIFADDPSQPGAPILAPGERADDDVPGWEATR